MRSKAIEISEVQNKQEKAETTRKIMHSLPEWFSPPEDIEHKAALHEAMPFFAAYCEGEPVGFIALKIHNAYTAEIHVVGVQKQMQGHGIGGQLVEAAISYLQKGKFSYLTAKTLDAAAEYAPYEPTRAFYAKQGFLPLEVLPLYWNKENPCLFLIKALK